MRLKFVLYFLLVFFGTVHGQESVLDSLVNRLDNSETDLDKTKLYNTISNQYKYSDPDKMLDFGSKALNLAKENNYKTEEGTAYLNIGTAYLIFGDYQKALDHFVWAKTIFEGVVVLDTNKNEISQGIAKTYGYMGVVFSEQSNYSKALQYYFKSVKIYEELNDEGQSSKIYNNIGVVYKSQLLDTKALIYFTKALKIQEKLQDPNIGITLTNIANIYLKEKKLDEAFEYYTLAKRNIDKHPNPRALGEWQNNMGAYYKARNQNNLATENWQNAILTFESFNDKFGLADTYLHLGEFYFEQKNKKQALAMANKALHLATEINVLEQKAVSEKLLSDIYAQHGNSTLALAHYKKYSSVKDSLVKESDIRKGVEATLKYEFEKKENGCEILLINAYQNIISIS